MQTTTSSKMKRNRRSVIKCYHGMAACGGFALIFENEIIEVVQYYACVLSPPFTHYIIRNYIN